MKSPSAQQTLFQIRGIPPLGSAVSLSLQHLVAMIVGCVTPPIIIAYGASNILTALFSGLPTAAYSQNVGIVTTNKVVNRVVFTLTGGFLLLAGLSPKFAAVLATIPQCVLGGATITVFSTIAMTGMKLIASSELSARNTTIVGLSAALGVGVSQTSGALAQFPDGFTHWVMWNYPAGAVIPGGLPKGARLACGAAQGAAYGLHCYAGPKPPPFIRHRYRLTVYALDSVLVLSPSARKRQFLRAAEGHILQKGSLTADFG